MPVCLHHVPVSVFPAVATIHYGAPTLAARRAWRWLRDAVPRRRRQRRRQRRVLPPPRRPVSESRTATEERRAHPTTREGVRASAAAGGPPPLPLPPPRLAAHAMNATAGKTQTAFSLA